MISSGSGKDFGNTFNRHRGKVCGGMCPPTPEETTPEVKMERNADVIKSDAQLTDCKTVAELLRKPDVGSVLLGGNNLAREHGALTDGMTCTVSSRYVAKCCFIARKSEELILEELILLPHSATIAELKRKLYRSFQKPVIAAISDMGISVSTEQEFIDSIEIVCKDPNGNIFEDTATLPSAPGATACADVGCHATFFFDVKPPSMRETYVKDRMINASSSAIEDFVHGLCGPEYPIEPGDVVLRGWRHDTTGDMVTIPAPASDAKPLAHVSKKEKKRAAAEAAAAPDTSKEAQGLFQDFLYPSD